MDPIDKAIIYELATNCRIPYDELGKRVGLSASTVWRRVSELEESGIIERYILTLSPSIISAELFNAIITLDGTCSDEGVFERIIQHENIMAATSVINRLCMVSYEASSPNEQKAIDEYLRMIPGVLSIDTYLIHGSPDGSIDKKKIEVEFSEEEKEILRVLIDNPRMSLNEMIERIGKPYRRIKKTLDDIIGSGKVRFGIQWNPNARGNEMFILKIEASPSRPFESLCEWLEERFPENYWWSYPVANTRTMLSNFVFEKLDHALNAKKLVSKNEMVQSVELFFVVSKFKRARLPERLLQRFVSI